MLYNDSNLAYLLDNLCEAIDNSQISETEFDRKPQEFVSHITPVDIVVNNEANTNSQLTENGHQTISNSWSEAETLLLLEGLEMYSEDWNKVAEHVKTKSVDDCIVYFLQLPIIDPHLKVKDSNIEDFKICSQIFSKSKNPLMSTIAYLNSILDPKLGSIAAKAAVEKYEMLCNGGKSSSIVESNPKLQNGSTSSNKHENYEETKTDEEPPETNKSISPVDEDKNTNGMPNGMKEKEEIDENDLGKIATAAFSTASLKSNEMAKCEKNRIRCLVMSLIELQLKRNEMKLKHVNNLENLLRSGHLQLDKQRAHLANERQLFSAKMIDYIAQLNSKEAERQNLIKNRDEMRDVEEKNEFRTGNPAESINSGALEAESKPKNIEDQSTNVNDINIATKTNESESEDKINVEDNEINPNQESSANMPDVNENRYKAAIPAAKIAKYSNESLEATPPVNSPPCSNADHNEVDDSSKSAVGKKSEDPPLKHQNEARG
ncbi:MAG: hypothetical protein MHMPM18_001568 [Marteilia pararefringens]